MTVLIFSSWRRFRPLPRPPTRVCISSVPMMCSSVTVFNQPQLSGKFAVEADGTFAFPLLGRVAAGGLSVRAIEDKVREGLAAGFLTDPRSASRRPVPQPADLRHG